MTSSKFGSLGTGGSLTVQRDTELVHGEVKRCTKVICDLEEDQSEFLEERRLEDYGKRRGFTPPANRFYSALARYYKGGV